LRPSRARHQTELAKIVKWQESAERFELVRTFHEYNTQTRVLGRNCARPRVQHDRAARMCACCSSVLSVVAVSLATAFAKAATLTEKVTGDGIIVELENASAA
jgi:hypothetical protein